MINPFDLPGPQFLAFYLLLLIGSASVVYLYWRSLEDRNNFRRPMTDPYQIAYLRGGAKEAVKIAAASLAHRKWLKVNDETLTSEPGQSVLATNQLEKEILEECLSGGTFQRIGDGSSAAIATKLFHKKLVNENLILSESQHQKALFIKTVIIFVLIAVAVFKIYVALQRGRHNLLFLILLSIGGVIAHLKYSLWYTPNGKTALKDLKVLFGRLRDQTSRLARESENHQFSFLIAVFGVAALSSTEYLFLSAFRPKQGSNSGCSSSCGSSGCGGGGGCGGCGS